MDTAAVRASRIGRVIDGRFSLLQWLGSSAWSDVFLTELPGRGSQKVAIKLIAADANDRNAYLSRWQVGTTLSHPHLVRLFHFGRCQIDTTPLLYLVWNMPKKTSHRFFRSAHSRLTKPKRCFTRCSTRFPTFTRKSSCMVT